ncbi:hypothetical protein OQJ65_08770 [Vibrio sp. Sgm 22]|uniref:hypothetical protein n=1 Tax=unclassified Vibrio TaxID=2614977 RepID=UPI002248AE46|nr:MULTISPECIES: hypothetical protein [unclassified Vibrio]MCX2758242.1 hypothetical protein [Vibrio sp. 14G-20]MCX2775398.1 hypothetical protein [Vibrio sp. Sgm 22]
MNKHAIVGFSDHVFTNLYIDVLINKCSVDPNSIELICLGDIEDTNENSRVHKVRFRDVLPEQFIDFKSITFISLNSFNSSYLEIIISYTRDNIYIYLTDDELARWKLSKIENGKVSKSNKLNIGESCVNVLPKIKNFISLGSVYREPLESVLERNDFDIIEGRDPFGTMPVEHLELLKRIYDIGSLHDSSEKSVLIGSKQGVFSAKEVIDIIRSFNRNNLLDEFKFHIFTNKNNRKARVIIDLYALYMRKIRKVKIDIGFPIATNSLTYSNLVMSCSVFLLQGRGGISTARTYLRFSRGIIAVQKNTPNESELVKGLGIDLISYTDFDDLVSQVINQSVDIERNSQKIEIDLKRSYDSLGNLYQ